MNLKIERSISVGDLLMSLTIIVSITALIITWTQDTQLRARQQADKVRNAASQTLGKLERWQQLSLWIFEETQPLFVETSERLADDFDIISARDFLWKGINAAKLRVRQRFLEEEIETAYVGLYIYHPAVRELFASTLAKFRREEDMMFGTLLRETQKDVLRFEDRKDNYTTAMLGNALRETASKQRKSYEQKVKALLEPMELFLAKLILKSDEDLLSVRVSPGLVQ